VRAAIAERKRRRGANVALRIVTVPDGFVAGEETALVSWLNGGPPKPTFTPPRPFERGVGGVPTLVQNVETLAHVALIARHGADWFRAVGTAVEPGTALVTLDGAIQHAGVYEIPLGLRLDELVAWAGGATEPVSAFLLGGYFGSWVDASTAARLPLLESDLRPVGASLGARAIYALPASACGVAETARVARYLAKESAGQCGPCVNGLDAIATALERLAAGRGDDRVRIARWAGQIVGRGACSHPDGAARFVESALTVFADEFERHARGRCTGDRRLRLPIGAVA
jgi:NADH:ubiquinone oxidoreductase subunit F (NADH-binding)